MQPINFDTPHGAVSIREATLADAVQFRELRLQALQNAPRAFSADYQTNLIQPMTYWENRLQVDEHSTIFFAEHTQRLIGMTGIRRRESPKTRHNADVLSVYVRPEWRGLHIAEALIEACVGWATRRNINTLKLGVMTDNTSAVQLYKRCGFQVYGTEPRDIFYEGQYYDLYLMHRELA